MNERFTSLGLMWSPPAPLTHAQVPTPLLLEDRVRVYVSCRDAGNRSHTYRVDLDRENPVQVLDASDTPVLSPGAPGTFDDSGAMASCAVQNGAEIRLYYAGWNRMDPTPYRNTIGLAVSRDNGLTFTRHSPAPLFERTAKEPYFFVVPWVLREAGIWHMWYGCITEWREVEGRFEPLYHIKYAHSKDGIDWVRDNISALPPAHPDEVNVRPAVICENGVYKMWYCYRNVSDYRDGAGAYRLGYAESRNAKEWTRQDERIAQMGLSPGGFDATMQAYPAVLDTGSARLLLWNGNGFGREGFGGAIK